MTRVKEARPRSGLMSSARTSASTPRPNVSTRAVVRAAIGSTSGSSAFNTAKGTFTKPGGCGDEGFGGCGIAGVGVDGRCGSARADQAGRCGVTVTVGMLLAAGRMIPLGASSAAVGPSPGSRPRPEAKRPLLQGQHGPPRRHGGVVGVAVERQPAAGQQPEPVEPLRAALVADPQPPAAQQPRD